MSHPAARVLAMLELLQAHHRLGGRELARRLGVDERTVRRYATTLVDLGVPVVAHRGRYGGYRLLPGYKLPPLMLTDEEAVAVVLGLAAAERLGLSATAPATSAALAKIGRVLPAALGERLAAVTETLGFTLRRREATPAATDTLLALGAATRDRRPVTLSYRSFAGAESVRRLDPYGLVFHAGRWYATGHDHRSGELRTFRLDRVTAVAPAPGEFTAPPPDFDAVGHVTRSLARVPYAWRVEVVLETDLAQARARVPATVGELAETDGGVLLRTSAEHLDGMAQMLAGLGWPFTVRSPDELRAAVAAYAARLAGWATR
ncbi:MAG TPA: YafY family protein [Pilimelia sp.]|nr:YafY family protein [Pilimelia sp.]